MRRTTPLPKTPKLAPKAAPLFVDLLIYNDLLALGLGIIFNALLILAIRFSHKRTTVPFMKLVYIASVFDFFFAVEESITQHQLHVKDGVIYILAHGVERVIPEHWYPICLIPHAFFTVHGLFILAALYHYRYRLMVDGKASESILTRDLCITVGSALFVAVCLTTGVYQGRKHMGSAYYYNKLDGEWFGSYGQRYFAYAADIRFVGTQLYFVFGLTIASTSVILICWYAYAAWKFVNPDAQASVTSKTKAMQAQFTKAIILQTMNAFLFAFFPVGLFVFLALFRLNGEFIGILVMAVVSWLPAANAIMTLYVVKDFRNFIKAIGGCRRFRVIGISTLHSSTMPKLSKTTVRMSSVAI